MEKARYRVTILKKPDNHAGLSGHAHFFFRVSGACSALLNVRNASVIFRKTLQFHRHTPVICFAYFL